ncbi:MAG: hypothetical protein QOC67_802 [Pseudonocardiales bacterium]|nr:hypothetical protein [Pseudonocardiales bacterium]MDT7771878.1 hypothetical protein [Pseudonocardiales bacterium]
MNPEPLLAGSRLASTLVWWPLLTVLYLMVAPGSNPVGVGLVGGGLVVIGLLRATVRVSARRHGARGRIRPGEQRIERPGEQRGEQLGQQRGQRVGEQLGEQPGG